MDYMGASSRKKQQLQEPLFVEDGHTSLQQDALCSKSTQDNPNTGQGEYLPQSHVDDDDNFHADGGSEDEVYLDTNYAPKPVKTLETELIRMMLALKPYEQVEKPDFYIFEPKNFAEKMKALFQNTYEILIIIGVILFAFVDPEIHSLLILLLTLLLFNTSVMKPDSKMIWGGVMLVIIGGTTFTLLNTKYHYIQELNQTEFKNMTSLNHTIFYSSFNGIIPEKTLNTTSNKTQEYEVETDKNGNTYFHFTINVFKSLHFELFVSIIFFLGMWHMFKHHERIEEYKNDKMGILLVKNYELGGSLFDDDEEDNQVGIGSKKAGVKNREKKEQIKILIDSYEEKMNEWSKEFFRNYIDCQWFHSANKEVFLIMLFFQVAIALNFNSLFDLPVLALILLVFTTFPQRKRYPQIFQCFVFFLTYLINFFSIVKVFYTIVIQIPYFQSYLQKNQNAPRVIAFKLIFGIDFLEEKNAKNVEEDKLVYYFLLSVILLTSHIWKQMKWAQIRWVLQTHNKKALEWNSFSQICSYAKETVKQKIVEELVEEQIKKQNKQKKGIKGNSIKMKPKTSLQKAKQDIDSWMPSLICWLQRLLLGYQAYLYTNEIGLFHVFWVLLSFSCSQCFLFFFSSLFYLSFFTWEFVMVYGSQIELVRDNQTYQKFGGFYFTSQSWQIQHPTIVLMLYFVIMLNFWLMLGYLAQLWEASTDDYAFKLYKSKIKDKKSSFFWKISIFVFERIHLLVLFAIFCLGIGNVNHLASLVFIIFFVVFTTYEKFYRENSNLMSIFIGYLIFAQYYFHIDYLRYTQNDGKQGEQIMKLNLYNMGWMGFFKCPNFNMAQVNEQTTTLQTMVKSCQGQKYVDVFPQWNPGDPYYFRAKPFPFDWGMLILMSFLQQVNYFFTLGNEIEELKEEAYVQIRDGDSTNGLTSFLLRLRNSLQRWIKYIVLMIMCYVNNESQTSLITFIFWTQFIILVCMIAKGDKKPATNKWLAKITSSIKRWTFLVTFIDIVFVTYIGEVEQHDKNSWDYWLRHHFSALYYDLDFIGVKVFIDPQKPLDANCTNPAICTSPQQIQKDTRAKFMTYIVYLILSIYLSGLFKQERDQVDGEMKFKDSSYKGLFEFRRGKSPDESDQEEEAPKPHQQQKTLIPITQSDQQKDEKQAELKTAQLIANRKKKNKTVEQVTTFKSKSIYYENDLKERYEFRLYNMPFIVYKWLHWWPVFDQIAKFGHIVISLIVVFIAINYNVSFFMFFNIACICFYYIIGIKKLGKRAFQLYKNSGLQSQTDLNKANVISKEYQKSTTYEFLKLRTMLWKVQIGVLAVCAICGFLTTLLDRSHKVHEYIANQELEDIQSVLNNQTINEQRWLSQVLDKTVNQIDNYNFTLPFNNYTEFRTFSSQTLNETINDDQMISNQSFSDLYENINQYRAQKKKIKLVDDWAFYCFMAGIWKDSRDDVKIYYEITFGLLFIGLMFEKQAINWLTNRWGCTYNKLQKFIELDVRAEAIRKKWTNMPEPIPYAIERYEQHYFYNDWERINERLYENPLEAELLRKKTRHSKDDEEQENRDFVPYNIAVRLYDAISFSTRLDGRDDTLKLSDNTREILDKRDQRIKPHLERIKLIRRELLVIKEAQIDQKPSKKQPKQEEIVKSGNNEKKQSVNEPLLPNEQKKQQKGPKRRQSKLNNMNDESLQTILKIGLNGEKEDVLVSLSELNNDKQLKEVLKELDIIIKENDVYVLTKKNEDEDDDKVYREAVYDKIVKYYRELSQLSPSELQLKVIKLKEELEDKKTMISQDYEDIEVLKKHKIAMHEKILRQAIDSKYKISLSKGFQLVFECLCFLVLMLSIMMKANIFSMIYLAFVFKYVLSKGKTELLVRMTIYIGICICVQYLLFFLNLTHDISPSPYPTFFHGYPMTNNFSMKKLDYEMLTTDSRNHYSITNKNGTVIYTQEYAFPLFFQWNMFHDLKLDYLIGIGVEKDQVQNLLLDFLNLYFVSMYILLFRNPVLVKSMTKVFWQFPEVSDEPQKWKRLNQEVKNQVMWYMDTKEFDEQKDLDESQKKNLKEKNSLIAQAKQEHKFAQKYKHLQINLNEKLITYIDLKYNQIWSEDFCKKIKWQMKQTSIYFRLVKQGSIVVYICQHVFTLLFILFMAVIRQSFISLGYFLMILPNLREAANVLKQNLISQNSEEIELQTSIDNLKQRNLQLQEQIDKSLDNSSTQNEIEKNDNKIKDKEAELREILNQKKGVGFKTAEQKQDEKLQGNATWSILALVKKWLLVYALLDYTLQVVVQLPVFPQTKNFIDLGHNIGFRKIYQERHPISGFCDTAATLQDSSFVCDRDFNFQEYEENPTHIVESETKVGNVSKQKTKGNQEQQENKYEGLSFQWRDFYILIMNCLMISLIQLQSQIFDSFGYQKFVTQNNGSMDLLVELSELKAKSQAMVFNNYKIKKIVNHKLKKEQVMETVELIKFKLQRWRAFTRTTLVSSTGLKSHQLSQKKQLKSQQLSLKARRESMIIDIREKFGNKIADEMGAHDFDEEDRQEIQHLISQNVPGFAEKIREIMQKANQKIKSASGKNVKIDETQNEVIENVVTLKDMEKEKPKVGINIDQQKQLLDILVKQFVKDKKKKLNCLSQFYLFLNDTFVEKIFFKNKPEQLKELIDQQSKGEVEIPTELDTIMKEDAEFLIYQKYDNLEGKKVMLELIDQMKNSKEKDFSLSMKNLNRRIKLQQMTKTWEFTRTGSILWRILETCVYMIISNTQGLLYFAFVFSMFQNSGLIGLFYTFSMFGYALLEEVRPRKRYWEIIRRYTYLVLILKLVFNLNFMKSLLQNNDLEVIIAYIKPGFVHDQYLSQQKDNHGFNELFRMLFFMLPEILITGLLMLHEIHLRLLGLFYVIELDIESVQDGITRINFKGDEKIIKQQKIQRANMNISQFFEGLNEQKENLEDQRDQEQLEKKILRQQRLNEGNKEPVPEGPLEKEEKRPLKDRQYDQFVRIANGVYDSTFDFDLDMFSTQEDSPLDKLVANRCLQKSLENDNVMFAEGNYKEVFSSEQNENFISQEELDQDYKDQCFIENHSAGDFDDELEEKEKMIKHAISPDLGLFDTMKYFQRIYPPLKIQKPGVDLYALNNIFLFFITVYTFMFYNLMTVDEDNYLNCTGHGDNRVCNAKNKSTIFNGSMVMLVLGFFTLIIFERVLNRTNTIKVTNKNNIREVEKMKREEETLKKAKMERTMTKNLKTLKTSDLEMGDGSAASKFLSSMGESSDVGNVDDTKIKITIQQKVKYALHLIFVAFIHIFVFWFIPISGNYQLYATPVCTQEAQESYGCKNFHSNFYLQIFYLLVCLYMLFTALQIKYGFPIYKIPSSVLQYNDNPIAFVGAQIYYALPFVIEMRCLIDYTFSKTALDIFQHWQCFQYHFDMYCAKNSNIWYTYKEIGIKTELLDKCIFGVLFSVVVGLLLVGPLVIFSDLTAFSQSNPVQSSNMALFFTIEKSFDEYKLDHLDSSLKQRMKTNYTEFIGEGQNLDISLLEVSNNTSSAPLAKSKVNYEIYQDDHPFILNYTEDTFKNSKYNNWTVTRFFIPQQVQDVVYQEYNDRAWTLSEDSKDALNKDIVDALDPSNHFYNFTFSMYSQFVRALPPDNPLANDIQNKKIDLTNLTLADCMSRKQLLNFAQRDKTLLDQRYQIRFAKAFNPDLLLGVTNYTTLISKDYEESETLQFAKNAAEKMLDDVLVTYTGRNGFSVQTTLPYNQVGPDLLVNASDPNALETCTPLRPSEYIYGSKEALSDNNDTLNELWEQAIKFQKEIDPDDCEKAQDNCQQKLRYWSRVEVTLFSLFVSASVFSAYNVSAFYTGVVVTAGSGFRGAMFMYTFMAWQYETLVTDQIMKIVEGIYIYRHEEQIDKEEECYRMLQEIMRQPELIKVISQSSLRGSLDPIYEVMNAADRKKYKMLDHFARKGLDVSKMRTKLNDKYDIDEGKTTKNTLLNKALQRS